MKKGFTLIELLVVVLIIAILAAVALPQYTAAVEKSRATEALLNVKALAGAADRYYLQNDAWPVNFGDLDVSIGNGCTSNVCVHGKYAYKFNGAMIAAYRGTFNDDTKITFGMFLAEDTNHNAVHGTFFCNYRDNNAWERVCRSIASSNTRTIPGKSVIYWD
ncbi:type II secretion system protein G [Parelusimicrobium proximum]|uniref:type IV pilin protein n=1 Tax=Parelusimicrobium proximum TaxID=3228953 RepID=UPI003D1806B5